jgi:hypothetical protein
MENLTNQRDNSVVDPAEVIGWAIDADPANDPTYPIKDRNNGEHAGYTWDRPDQQRSDVEVLHSNERPNLTAAFGTTLPPSGLSGVIRRAAFNYSEDAYMHWLPLMLADRIGMVEGILDDVGRGRIPNIFGEMGWKADWKHNRPRLAKNVAVGAGIAVLAVYLLKRNKDN